MDYSLALSLGHNSSAVLIKDGEILIGYEEERLSGIKSDSHFPKLAIHEISFHYDLDQVTDIYVSHWATFGEVSEMSEKHWDSKFIRDHFPNAEVHASADHHDCHVASLRAFAGKTYEWEIVADGFGNFNEVISIYKNGTLHHRVFGFEKSLGLLYQYSTAFLGLKMNQDEYKLLGYETFYQDVLTPDEVRELTEAAHVYAKKYLKAIMEPDIKPEYDLVAGLEALPNIRLKIRQYLEYVLYTKMNFSKKTMKDTYQKVIVAFFVQKVVETVMSGIIVTLGIEEVGLAGGLFMNVKLNNKIASFVKEICVMPLCGDQGAGIGAYHLAKGDLKWPDHLFWGKRSLDFEWTRDKKILLFDSELLAHQVVQKSLAKNMIVNYVNGNMEFGARALGHTTTLAIPTKENVQYINHLNERATIMPMAGMVLADDLKLCYNGSEKVHKSLEYMIMTVDLVAQMHSKIAGCHHADVERGVYTNRVQLIDMNHCLYGILRHFGILINTSFNRHGVPIVFNSQQIYETHMFQAQRDIEDRMITIVIDKG